MVLHSGSHPLPRRPFVIAAMALLGCSSATSTAPKTPASDLGPSAAPGASAVATTVDTSEPPARPAEAPPTSGDSPATPGARPATRDEPTVDPELNQAYVETPNPERWEQRFEREGREVFDNRQRIVSALALTPGQRVADVGAGTGLFTLALAEAVGPQGQVYAVDVHPFFLTHIAAKAEAAGLDNIVPVRATQTASNLPEGEIDVAFMCDVYHHLEQPIAYLSALRGQVVPGGRLVVIDFKRVPGAPEWVEDHVRASPDVFQREIEAAGWTLRERKQMLADNFFYVFENPSPAR